jgi:hypothetical protein
MLTSCTLYTNQIVPETCSKNYNYYIEKYTHIAMHFVDGYVLYRPVHLCLLPIGMCTTFAYVLVRYKHGNESVFHADTAVLHDHALHNTSSFLTDV